jgi:hypothetical protein
MGLEVRPLDITVPLYRMSSMKKILLVITRDQKSWIEGRAKKLGTSQTEILRRLIDAEVDKMRTETARLDSLPKNGKV